MQNKDKIDDKMHVVIISGMSGAGKTNAANWFEDQGCYCVDNMPPGLITNFLDLVFKTEDKIDKVVLVMDIRGDEFFSGVINAVENLRHRRDVDLKVLFMEASTNCIVRRYNEKRRNHPLNNGPAGSEIIERERELLREIRLDADVIIDTTGLKLPAFSSEMERIFLKGEAKDISFNINLQSFGYKYGLPDEADMILDMRFIPNPYYVPSLKKLTGNNKKVSDFVLRHQITVDFARDLESLLRHLIPYYEKEGKKHINLAFGCTGGHHRSVAMANEMKRRLSEAGYRTTIKHRDL